MLTTTFETLSNGRKLRIARLGSGPPLLLLHGYPENLQIWSELAPRLAESFEVIAFDWPGMGYSDEWPGGATPVLMARKLLSLIDEWKLPKVGLLGMDMGGQPALAFAARYPEHIDRLIVMNSLVFADEATSWEIRVLRKFGFNRMILQRLPRSVFRRAERTFLPPNLRLPDDMRADFWNAFRVASVRRFISKMCAGYQGTLPDLHKFYAEIQCRTLILWGDNDKHFPLEHPRRLHTVVPNSRLEILPRAEHWMAWHMADDVAEKILQFSAVAKPVIAGSAAD